MSLYSSLARPLLFRLPAETAHELSLKMLALAAGVFGRHVAPPAGKPLTCFGLNFPNAVGLAAGMDKNAIALPVWPLLGFGFVEIGTVTAQAQPGNPKPRVFRLPLQGGLINRLGFNNEGAEAVAKRLAWWRSTGRWPQVPVGINLGKSRSTPLANAAEDYAVSFRLLRGLGDYFVVNVSSPNTPGLRELQSADHLSGILRALARENTERKPILVKIAPDLDDQDIDTLVEVGEAEGVAGWIATNTTLDHRSVSSSGEAPISGGLSGEPLRVRATEVVRHTAARATQPIIGVGGVSSVTAAQEKLEAGASLVQLYTGLIYGGPKLPRLIADGLTSPIRG